MYKILGSEAAANTTASRFANNRVIRLAHVGAAARTLTLFENTQDLPLTINASANGTTLLTLTTGNTANLTTGMRITGSSNLAVVNTRVASEIATIVNTTAVAVNVDIIIANGVCQVAAAGSTKTFTMVPNSEFVLEKGRTDFLQSNNDTEILAIPVSYKG